MPAMVVLPDILVCPSRGVVAGCVEGGNWVADVECDGGDETVDIGKEERKKANRVGKERKKRKSRKVIENRLVVQVGNKKGEVAVLMTVVL